MADEAWIRIVLSLLGLGLTVTLTLLGILFSWLRTRIEKDDERRSRELSEFRQYVNDRLRTLGHEDRDIRAQVDSVIKMLVDDLRGRKQ